MIAKNKIRVFSQQTDDAIHDLLVYQEHGDIVKCPLYANKKFLFIGVSLGNSFFSEKNLAILFDAFSPLFEKIGVVLVDKLSMHNYRAIQYDEGKAEKKLRRDANHMLNKFERIFTQTSFHNIDVYQWKDIESFGLYQKRVEAISYEYENNKDFKDTIDQTVGSVLCREMTDESDKQYAIDHGKWYFLKEIAFGTCINDFFNEKEVLTSYNRDLSFYRKYLQNMQTDENHRQAFMIYNIETRKADSA